MNAVATLTRPRAQRLTDTFEAFVIDEKGRARAQPGFFDDHTIAAALCLYAHAGDEKAPLLPLPEQEVASHAMQLLLIRDRDPEAAEQQAQGLFGLTADEVVRVYDARAARDREAAEVGIGGER